MLITIGMNPPVVDLEDLLLQIQVLNFCHLDLFRISCFEFRISLMTATSSQFSCLGHLAQSLQTFIGKALLSTTLKPSFSKNCGFKVRPNTFGSPSRFACSTAAVMSIVPAPLSLCASSTANDFISARSDQITSSAQQPMTWPSVSTTRKVCRFLYMSAIDRNSIKSCSAYVLIRE